MLYDNAQLAMIYLRAAQVFKQPAYRDIAFETLDFMLHEMRVGGGFITSISAVDDKGNEGGAYLWTEEQLKAVLDNEEYGLVASIWGMSSASDFDFGYLPGYHQEPTLAEQNRLQEIYPRLMRVREERVIPKDTKLLAGLNGMVLEALSEAAVLAPRYRQAADELSLFMLKNFWQNDTLHKGVSNQQLLGQGDLEAYAFSASALMRYAQLGGNAEAGRIARQVAKLAWQKFYTPHGFLLEQGVELAKPYYQAVIEDGPLPSPSSVLIKMSLQSGDKELRKLAISALADGDASLKKGLFWFSTQVIALNRLFGLNTRH
jgi:hypothetical protein